MSEAFKRYGEMLTDTGLPARNREKYQELKTLMEIDTKMLNALRAMREE